MSNDPPSNQDSQDESKNGRSSSRHVQTNNSIEQNLEDLINNLPLAGSIQTNAINAARETMKNLLIQLMAPFGIRPQPSISKISSITVYEYTGSFQNFKKAFFDKISPSNSAIFPLIYLETNTPNNFTRIQNFMVTLITDAIRVSASTNNIPISLNTSHLAGDLATFFELFKPALAAAYTGTLAYSYSPTSTYWDAMNEADQLSDAYVFLVDWINSDDFRAILNSQVDSDPEAATWQLFNLWNVMASLSGINNLQDISIVNPKEYIQNIYAKIDQQINVFITNGLSVPSAVGAGNWWNGNYINWFHALNGSDFLEQVDPVIKMDMPENATLASSSGGGFTEPTSLAYGYAQSYCLWTHDWYAPQVSSCLGSQSKVLMANGTVKEIAQIKPGEQIYTDKGPRKVVLIESPYRKGRELYQINDLAVYATASHPFRTSSAKSGIKRVAAAPWQLIDTIPSLIGKGVGRLNEGSHLLGIHKSALQTPYRPNLFVAILTFFRRLFGIKNEEKVELKLGSVKVEEISVHKAKIKEEAPEMRVYDLIVEGWAKDQAAYFVGGPEAFVAVDAETGNPLTHPHCTMAVLAAMEESLSSGRKFLYDPAAEIPLQLHEVDFKQCLDRALLLARRAVKPNKERPQIPPASYYMKDDEWDPVSSMLEAYLVRHLSRIVRRESVLGWRAKSTPHHAEDHYVVSLFDLELHGENAIPAGAKFQYKLLLDDPASSTSIEQVVEQKTSATPQWLVQTDQITDFGSLNNSLLGSSLKIELSVNENPWGLVLIKLSAASFQHGIEEHFVYNNHQQIIGRLAIEHRSISSKARSEEQQFSNKWNTNNAKLFAINFGRQVGIQLNAAFHALGLDE